MPDKNNCAPRPPMGWNSWDCYGAAVNEEQLLGNAEYMRDNLKEYGWEYVVCDIQWSEPTAVGYAYNNFVALNMDAYSRLIPAVNRFPSSADGKGFKPIADKIHAMGLKFGIHIMRGIPRQAVHRNTAIKGTTATARDIALQYSICPWNTDMYGIDYRREGAQAYYNSIFELYASWDVDYVKVDDIANTEHFPNNPYSAEKEIEMIRKAIDNCGREMVLNLSPGPAPVS
ncbi:MAG: glycoside hydrolase family 27 protein, partial [Clostridia bacterium]|nr:glycoside hydrolase family 27 protein [Clostridia bacterium]